MRMTTEPSTMTLLSYEGGVHSRWPPRRGEEEEVFIYLFLFFFPPLRWSRCPYMGKPLSSWGAVLLYALVCGMTNQPINKNWRLGGRVGVFSDRFVRAVGEEEQAHLYGEAAQMYRGTLSLVCCMANVDAFIDAFKNINTVGGLGSEARFQVKKSACFWCHGRYHEWWVFSPKLKPIHRASIHPIHFDEFFSHRRMVKYRESIIFVASFPW